MTGCGDSDDKKPDDDKTPVSASHFNDIKKAYTNAGYQIDVAPDSSTKTVIDSMKAAYASMGYSICTISKNTSNVMSMELYLLFEADTTAHANEIADTYDGTYKYAKSGRDVIVAVMVMGSENFTPFNSAT